MMTTKIITFLLQFFGLTISTPYANLQIDQNIVQNLENFWINFVYCSVFLFGYTGLNVYQINISIIHREISNKLYLPSAYYVSELVLSVSINMLVGMKDLQKIIIPYEL